jgi:peptidoglycan/xylan/chitin deacetylase (PgdA/CDA1 family)
MQIQYKLLSRIFPNIIWSHKINNGSIYLTFDDGPHPEFTPQVLTILRENNLRATFFLVGELMQKYPQVVSQIKNEGHAIGLHSYSHSKLIFKSRQQLINELLMPRKILKDLTGIQSHLFRPPFGIFTPYFLKLCNRYGFQIVMWSILTADYDIRISDQQILLKIMKNLEDGDILLLHDGHKHSGRMLQLLPSIIQAIHHQNKTIKPLTKPTI